MKRINRLLVAAPPGEGKTTLLRRIIRTFRPGGSILDPLGEFVDGFDYEEPEGVHHEWRNPIRWDSVYTPAYDAEKIKKTLEELESGHALIADEVHRLAAQGAAITNNRLVEFLDVARNYKVKWVIASKRPTKMSDILPDLADVFVFKPWRGKSARDWLRGCGVDNVEELAPLPFGRWYILHVGGDVEVIEDAEITELFER